VESAGCLVRYTSGDQYIINLWVSPFESRGLGNLHVAAFE
jgi:hypothetical protein